MAGDDDQGRASNLMDDDERIRRWAATCDAIDAIAPEVIRRCIDIDLPTTRLRGFNASHAWTFDVITPSSDRPWDVQAHMHLGFLADGDWVLLGHSRGDYRQIVDKHGPLHPGLRQEFIYDRRRRQADVIVTLSREQIFDVVCGQIYILAALGREMPGGVDRRSRYS